jgi:hypothetical protein
MPEINLLDAPAAAALVGLDVARFQKLVTQGHYPIAGGPDPARPQWRADELRKVLDGRDRYRHDKMIASGLLVDLEPKPSGARIECLGRFRKPRPAGEVQINIGGYGAKAYRFAESDYRVWLPIPRTPRAKAHVLKHLDAIYPELAFSELDESGLVIASA